MKIFRNAAIAFLIVCGLTCATASAAARYTVFNSVTIPNLDSISGHVANLLSKNTISPQYVQNKISVPVYAMIGGDGMSGAGFQPTWEKVSANSWRAMGYYNDGANPNQYGIFPSSQAALRLKSADKNSRVFSGTWITDKEIYDAFTS